MFFKLDFDICVGRFMTNRQSPETTLHLPQNLFQYVHCYRRTVCFAIKTLVQLSGDFIPVTLIYSRLFSLGREPLEFKDASSVLTETCGFCFAREYSDPAKCILCHTCIRVESSYKSQLFYSRDHVVAGWILDEVVGFFSERISKCLGRKIGKTISLGSTEYMTLHIKGQLLFFKCRAINISRPMSLLLHRRQL